MELMSKSQAEALANEINERYGVETTISCPHTFTYKGETKEYHWITIWYGGTNLLDKACLSIDSSVHWEKLKHFIQDMARRLEDYEQSQAEEEEASITVVDLDSPLDAAEEQEADEFFKKISGQV